MANSTIRKSRWHTIFASQRISLLLYAVNAPTDRSWKKNPMFNLPYREWLSSPPPSLGLQRLFAAPSKEKVCWCMLVRKLQTTSGISASENLDLGARMTNPMAELFRFRVLSTNRRFLFMVFYDYAGHSQATHSKPKPLRGRVASAEVIHADFLVGSSGENPSPYLIFRLHISRPRSCCFTYLYLATG